MTSKTDKDQVTGKKLLELLQKVLPKATDDPKLAGRIIEAVESELKLSHRRQAFEKLCKRCELPDLEEKSVEEVRSHLENSFADGALTLKPMEDDHCLRVDVALPDGESFTGMIRTKPEGEVESEDEEIVLKFIPFPVSMPGDKELVWMLAKHENLSAEEAGRSLFRAEEEFWASKTGQNLLRKHVERSFPEFIARVPAGLLKEMGLKRHYKTPEPVKTVHLSPGQ